MRDAKKILLVLAGSLLRSKKARSWLLGGLALAGVFGVGLVLLSVSVLSTAAGYARERWSVFVTTPCFKTGSALLRVEPWVSGDPLQHLEQLRGACLPGQSSIPEKNLGGGRET
jgi:hypothetical protein